jgi:hypothetical protein
MLPGMTWHHSSIVAAAIPDPRAHPLNGALVRSLQARKRCQGDLIAPREGAPDPYMNAGSHPDIVERVWDRIGAALPPGATVRVCGAPGLVHVATGVVLALAYGTQYVLRLGPARIVHAQRAGAKTVTKWSGGQVTDIAAEFGDDWIFGNWDEREPAWVRERHDELG